MHIGCIPQVYSLGWTGFIIRLVFGSRHAHISEMDGFIGHFAQTMCMNDLPLLI